MKKRKLSCSVGFEKLELRRLLAADLGVQAMPEIPITEPAPCEVASFECGAEEMVADAAIESGAEVVDEGLTTPRPDPRVLDLADGMDGYFGAINSENPAETLEFTAARDGMAEVVLTSSLGDAHASLTISNSQGDVIDLQSEHRDGFEISSFEVNEGETYQLSITSENPDCKGHFQLTVGFEVHVDQHADEIGSESTELTLVDNSAELSGRLESAGDIDTFRFTATDNGEVTLELHETVNDSRMGLIVGIQDTDGNILAEGSTNEMLQISFDVEAGQEYFVSLAGGEGQRGTYNLGLDLEPVSEPPAADIIDGEIAAEPEVIDSEVSVPSSDEPAETTDGEVVSDQGESTIETDSELVDANTESAEPDVTDEADAPVDADLPVDCELVENEPEAIGSEIIDEPIPGELTDEIVSEPVDQQPVEQLVPNELVAEEQSETDLSDAFVDCDEDKTTVSDDTSETESESSGELVAEPVAGDLIAVTGDEAERETDIDQPTTGFDSLQAVDNFFANLGNEFELHFDFSFGHRNLDRILSLV